MSFCGTIEMIAAEQRAEREMMQLVIQVAMEHYEARKLAQPYMGATVGEAISALQEDGVSSE